MGFGDWVRLMNWGCVPGSLNGWVGVSPLWLDGLGSEIDSWGFFVTLFFVKPSDDPVSLSKAKSLAIRPTRDVMLCSCRLLLRTCPPRWVRPLQSWD